MEHMLEGEVVDNQEMMESRSPKTKQAEFKLSLRIDQFTVSFVLVSSWYLISGQSGRLTLNFAAG